MIRLLRRRTKQNVQGISDNLRNRPFLREYDVGHACKIIVEKRTKYGRFQRLYKSSEARNIAEKGRDLTTLSAEINGTGVVCQALGNVR